VRLQRATSDIATLLSMLSGNLRERKRVYERYEEVSQIQRLNLLGDIYPHFPLAPLPPVDASVPRNDSFVVPHFVTIYANGTAELAATRQSSTTYRGIKVFVRLAMIRLAEGTPTTPTISCR
jgi:hypothetical protein